MSASREGACIAVRDVRTALETLGDALAGARLEDLLRAEPILEAAVSRLGEHRPTPDDDRHALAQELAGMAGALARCRVLGQALTDAVGLFAATRGDVPNYARDGREQDTATPAPRSLEARV